MGGGASRNNNADGDYTQYLQVTEGILDVEAEKRLNDALGNGTSVAQWYEKMNERYGTRTKKVILDVVEQAKNAASDMKKTAAKYKYVGPDQSVIFLQNDKDLLYYIFMDYFVRNQMNNAHTSFNASTITIQRGAQIRDALRNSLPLFTTRSLNFMDGHPSNTLSTSLIKHISDLLWETPDAHTILSNNAKDEEVIIPPPILPRPYVEPLLRADRRNRDREPVPYIQTATYIFECDVIGGKVELCIQFKSEEIYEQHRMFNFDASHIYFDNDQMYTLVRDTVEKKYPGKIFDGTFEMKRKAFTTDKVDLIIKYGP